MTQELGRKMSRAIRAFAGHMREENVSDRDLLARYASEQDEGAFTILVRRHAGMVLGVARRVLGHEQDAEDVCQAAFLLLARKSSRGLRQQSVAGWLNVSARLIALNARKAMARRTRAEARAGAQRLGLPPATPLNRVTATELVSALDEELARLPDRYRGPLVLCCLEGLSRDSAAGRLGVPVGTLRIQLERARQRLRAALQKRGIELGVALLVVAVAPAISAARPQLVQSIMAAVGGAVSPAVTVLAQAITAMTKIKLVLAAVLVGGLATVTLVAGHRFPRAEAQEAVRDKSVEATASVGKKPATTQQTEPDPLVGLLGKEGIATLMEPEGEPLPSGVFARMGSSRLRMTNCSQALAISPNGELLAAIDGNRHLFLWDVATGKRKMLWELPTCSRYALAFAVDSATLTWVGMHNDVKWQVLDVATGNEVARHHFHGDPGFSEVVVSTDGLKIAAVRDDRMVVVYDPSTGQETVRIPIVASSGRHLAFAPDGKAIAITENDRVNIHEATNGRLIAQLALPKRLLEHTTFSPDGRKLAVTVANNRSEYAVCVADVASAKELYQLKQTSAPPGCVAFSRNGKLLVTAGAEMDLVLWDAGTGKELRRYHPPRSVIDFVFTPDDNTLAIANWEGIIALCDVATGRLSPASGDPLTPVLNLRFTDGGKHLLGAADRNLCWDTDTGREVRRFPEVCPPYRVAALSPNETLLAGAMVAGPIRLSDARTNQELRTLKGHSKSASALQFSPDGRLLYSGGLDGTIRIWSVATGREIHCLRGHQGQVHAIAVSPDGRRLASRGSIPDLAVHLWDLTTFKEIKRFAPLHAATSALEFSPDSRWLAVGCCQTESAPDGRIVLCDAATGKEWRVMEGHEQIVGTMAFSPDGRLLATGSYDHTLRVWELASGRQRFQFNGHQSYLCSVAFSPDSRLLAASSSDVPVYIWRVRGDLPPEKLSEAELKLAWSELAAEDAALAYRAMQRLSAAPGQTSALLRQRLKPATAVDAYRVRRLILQLDSPKFSERSQASAELEKLGPRIIPTLRLALDKPVSLEHRQRLERLLAHPEELDSETLRASRAVEVMEWIGTPEVVQLLDRLSKGASDAPLTREATRARHRLWKAPG